MRKLIRHLMLLLRLKQPIKNLLPTNLLTRVLIKIYLHLPTQRQEHLIIPNIWLMRKTEPILWHKNSNSHIPAS